MTLGNAAAARVRLIVWCRDCAHQFEPDPHPSPGVALGSRRSLYVRAWQSADSLLERTGFEPWVPGATSISAPESRSPGIVISCDGSNLRVTRPNRAGGRAARAAAPDHPPGYFGR